MSKRKNKNTSKIEKEKIVTKVQLERIEIIEKENEELKDDYKRCITNIKRLEDVCKKWKESHIELLSPFDIGSNEDFLKMIRQINKENTQQKETIKTNYQNFEKIFKALGFGEDDTVSVDDAIERICICKEINKTLTDFSSLKHQENEQLKEKANRWENLHDFPKAIDSLIKGENKGLVENDETDGQKVIVMGLKKKRIFIKAPKPFGWTVISFDFKDFNTIEEVE